MTIDTSTEAVKAEAQFYREYGFPKASDLIEELVGERDAKEADARHYNVVADAASKVADLRFEDLATLRGENERALAVIEAARCIRHWHDAMEDSSGMVVSAEHVRLLWTALEEYDAARAAISTKEPTRETKHPDNCTCWQCHGG